ncbi:hypothetical protein KC340_g18123 [Hortaea werneckii]|nr:hypothetical protein KC342_g10910 [Hortaea werneckii]KAI7109634.1 hypothetical protein KC339_g600 [Hortaea werneckii]KAI7204559.1 hypothetical protein KC365_g17930 [Hortaea werneckii]KAI7287353.1 hypothetical protein KC340_g18123 [Hortaea werneckii]KAI7404669.1 hypothetical protein KC328_g1850 [Hortaea werneckii]
MYGGNGFSPALSGLYSNTYGWPSGSEPAGSNRYCDHGRYGARGAGNGIFSYGGRSGLSDAYGSWRARVSDRYGTGDFARRYWRGNSPSGYGPSAYHGGYRYA